tara:strand:- start:29 stop:538 length:510 start_codon:yes stop_codon:yes gene_type:complete
VTGPTFGRDGEVTCDERKQNKFLDQDEWIDDFPISDGLLELSAEQLRFCEDLIDGRIKNDRLVRAANIFHKALTIYRKLPESHDVALALFISALEAVGLPENESVSCRECGQPQHKISQRVTALGVKHLGSGVERTFKQAYNRRSKYLHAGRAVASEPMLPHIIRKRPV